MMRLTEGVKNILIIIGLFFLLGYVLQTTSIFPFDSDVLKLYFPTSNYFKPHQLITSLFYHEDFNHIFFNVLMLIFLGPMTESILGTKSFVKMYFLAGFGGILLKFGIAYFTDVTNIVSWGASGCLFGIYGVLLSKVPNTQLMLVIPPIPVKVKYIVLGLIAYDLFQGLSGANTGVGHFAHIGGAIVGFIYAHFFHKSDFG